MSMHDGHYPVFWPRASKTASVTALAPRLDSLDGKRIAILWDYLFRGDEIFPHLQRELSARYPSLEFIGYDVFGSTHGDQEREIIAGLPTRLEELGADAVLSGIGC